MKKISHAAAFPMDFNFLCYQGQQRGVHEL